MTDRAELFAVKRLGTKLSLTTLDGVAGIGITNMVSHTGVAVEISREDARRLGLALIAVSKPDPTPCETCGEPADAKIRRLWQSEFEPACNKCAQRIAHVDPALPLDAFVQ